MSNVTSPKTGNAERPNEGLRQDDPIEVDRPVNVDIANEDPRPDDPIEVDRPVNVDIASEGSEEGEIRDDPPVGTKSKHSPSSEKQPSPKRIKPDPKRSGILFEKRQNPFQKTPCVISVNQQQPIGKLYRATEGFMIMMFIDAGLYGPPSITLYFSTDGHKEAALCKWDTLSNDEGRPAMSNIQFGTAPINGNDPRVSDPKVLKLCKLEHAGDLLYMRFRSWDQTKGFRVKKAFKNESEDIRRSVKSMIFAKEQFEVMLWFIAPFYAHIFMRHCLSFFVDSERHRLHPFHEWKDANGVYYEDTVALEAPKSLAYNGSEQLVFRSIVGQKQSSRSAHLNAAKDTVPDGGLVNSEVEQPTTEPSSALPHLEQPVSTAAPDTEMPERSPPPSSQDQESDVSSSESEIQPAVSRIIFDLANTGDYIPSEYQEKSDGSEPESESDSGSKTRRDGDDGERGEGQV